MLTYFRGALLVLVLGVTNLSAQHGHLNVGATSANNQLVWANGGIFATNSGFIRQMTYADAGRFDGWFAGNISLTALAGTTNNNGPIPGHADLGSFVVADIVSVSGPQGGSFAFWETNGSMTPIFMGTNGFSGMFSYDLSDPARGAGAPGADPYGHIHGRSFGVSMEGIYTVGFRARDISTNGAGGGPLHNPSDILYINFQAVPEPSSLALGGLGAIFACYLFRRRRCD